MAGQSFSASSEPNYRHWASGALLVLGLIGSLWYACRSPEKPSFTEEAEPRFKPAGGSSRDDLVARLEAAHSRLSQAQEAIRVAGGKIGELNNRVARFRREAEERGEYFPPPLTDVRHLPGEVAKRPNGDSWRAEGEWFNLGETIADGYAELQLRVGGRLVGGVQKVRIGPISSGGRFPYKAIFPRAPGDDSSQSVEVQADWSQI